jgi:spore germination cell wall hydrolase CwlJ-like protein
VTLQGHIDIIQADNSNLSAQISTLTQQIDKLRAEVERKEKADRGGERIRYELSPEERNLVERVVMAEAADEPYQGQVLVCQCILNACENLDKRPADIIRIYKYAKGRPAPSDSVKQAVAAVFDKGEQVESEKIIYFYAPALVESKFHESKRFVVEVAGHRFFAEK